MSIIGDIYYEKYGDFIEAADKYIERVKKQLSEEKESTEQKLNSKIDNLQKMLLNVCENAYKLRSGRINSQQLLSIVNGCLSPEMIDYWTTKYLYVSEQNNKPHQKVSIKRLLKEQEAEYDKNQYVDTLTQQVIDDAFNEED